MGNEAGSFKSVASPPLFKSWIRSDTGLDTDMDKHLTNTRL